jgi:hypothetical protein
MSSLSTGPGRLHGPDTSAGSCLASTGALILFSIAAVSGQGPGALPEGGGIAVSFPGDKGIADHPAVKFAEDFEDISATALAPGSPGWDNVWGEVLIVQETGKVHAGEKAAELSHKGPESSIGAWRDFRPDGFDTLFVRYYMKYHSQFPGCHHTGMSVLAAAPGVNQGSATGVQPDGTNHFSATLDDIPPFFSWSPEGNRPPGYSYIYCYHMDQGSQWGDVFMPSGTVMPGGREVFGDGFVSRPDIILDRDRWYCFELMVAANAPGGSDGRVAFWVDGELKADFPGLRFRSVNSLNANTVIMGTWSSEYYANQTLWYDDIVAATSYIGPMTGELAAGAGGGAPKVRGDRRGFARQSRTRAFNLRGQKIDMTKTGARDPSAVEENIRALGR